MNDCKINAALTWSTRDLSRRAIFGTPASINDRSAIFDVKRSSYLITGIFQERIDVPYGFRRLISHRLRITHHQCIQLQCTQQFYQVFPDVMSRDRFHPAGDHPEGVRHRDPDPLLPVIKAKQPSQN
jgi:hypothetical protein